MSSTIDAYAWMDQAACKDMDLSEHDPFDPPTGGKYQAFVDEALAICSGCAVRNDCLEDALRMGDTYGVKGGKTGPEREAILNPPKVPAQREPVEKKKTATAVERKRAYRERHRAEINARKREEYRKKTADKAEREKENARKRSQYADLTEDQRARRREQNREAVAAYRARQREAAEPVEEFEPVKEVVGEELSVA